MPPSNEGVVHRLDLIESELSKVQSEYPDESALDRVKFVRSMVRLVRSQIDDDATVPVLNVEVHLPKEY